MNASRYACEQLESRTLFATTYTLTDLGTLGGGNVKAYDISSNNVVVGHSDIVGSLRRAFRWTAGTMTNLGTLGGSSSEAMGINASGIITGSSLDATEIERAFRYDGVSMTDIGTLGGLEAHGTDINGIGTIVGGSSTAVGGFHAFRYTVAGGMVDLGTASGFPYSDAYGINNTGQVVGSSSDDFGGGTAWINTAGVFTPISLGGSYSFGWDLNDAGAAVGEGFLPGNVDYRAFLYADGRTISLGTLPGYGSSFAYGINNNGQIVGSVESTTGGLNHGFIYAGGKMIDLNTLATVPGGGTITEARSINDSGRIVGFGVVSGVTRAFMLTPVLADTTPPTATGASAGVTVAGATSHPLTVTYTDNVSVDVSTIGTGDVLVTGPNGFSQIASFVSIDNPTNGTPRTATYSVVPPGGSWDFTDNGTFTIKTFTAQVADHASRNLQPSTLTSFVVNVPDTTPPSPSLNASDLTTGFGTTYNFTVTYTDNNKLSVATLDSSDVTVTNTLGFSQTATFVSVNNATDGTPRTATYQITAPGGTWNTADNDTYTVSMNASQVSDPAGNFVVAGSLGTFTVDVDTIKPTVSTHSAPDLTVGFGTTYQFTVTYADNVAVKRSTIDGSDVRVTGPNAFNQLASLVSINAAGDGTPRTATYRINAPGGTWDTGDNGTYTLALEASQITDTTNNAADSGTITTFDVDVDTIKPVVNTYSASNVSVAGGTTYQFTVTYTDNEAIAAASLGNSDVRVTGPNAFNQLASLVSVDIAGDGTPRTATYQITAPGGTWDSGDDDTYTLALESGQVADTSGNTANSGTIGTFLVDIPDVTPPTFSSLSAANVTTGFGTSYTFTVTYADNYKIDVSSLDSSDVTVTNTLGFTQTATFVSVNNATNGTPRTATYSITPPGGSWDTPDNDTYTVALNASEVSDPAGNFVADGTLGTFTVNVDTVKPTVSTHSAANVTTPGGTTYQFTVTYADNVAIQASSLGNNDVRVTGPNAFNQLASFVSVNTAGNGTPRTVTYQINTPGGAWDTGDNGTYTLALEASAVTDTSNNAADAVSSIGTFTVDIDGVKPTVSTFSASNVSTAGGTTYQFTVTYADNVALAAASFDGSDVRVTGPNSFNQLASFVSVDTAGNGTPRTVTYQITAPGGTWDSGDDDTYTLSLESAQVADTTGNTANSTTIGTFLVDIPDVTPPTFSSLSAGNVTSGGGTTYQFTVTYADNYKVNVSSLDSSDVTVTNTLGFTQTATFVSVNNATNGTPRTATYSITPPGGSWDTPDNDTYTVALNASQVSDPAGNFVASGTLGTFSVNVDTVKPTVSTFSASDVTSGGGSTYQFTVSYADNVAIKASTLGNNDVRVTGPNAFNQLASFVSVNTAGDGTPRTVTYQINTPGGAWDTGDNGTYTLALEASAVTDTSNNAADAVASIGTFDVDVDTVKPTVSAHSAADVTTPGGTTYSFTVTYADNVALAGASLDGSDVRVTGPGGFDQLAALVSVDVAGDGTPRTATYSITPAGGSWDADDIGTYTLALQSGQVSDTSSNSANAATIGTFAVDLPEAVAPTASLTAANVTSPGGTTYTFTVTYSDNNKISVATLDSSDVTVTNATLGFSETASFVSVDVNTDGSPRTATYSITPPGGAWDLADNGTYTVSMNASEVSDPAGNFVAAGSLGTFDVDVDSTKPTVSTFSAANVTSGGGTSYQFTVTYADNAAVQASSLDNSDVRVTGPNGFDQLATFVSLNVAGDGTPRTATYQITPPGGAWDAADSGTYNLALEAGQVSDVNGNTADAVATIGTFSVSVSSQVQLSGGVLTVTGTTGNDVISLALNGAGDTLTVTYNGTDFPFAYPGTITQININVGNGSDTVTVGAGIIGVSVSGGAGHDTVTGGTGNDSLNGGDGNDRVSGGLGNDTYVFFNAGAVQTDTVIELAGQGIDTLDFTAVTNAVTVNLTSDSPMASHTSRTIVTGGAGQAANFEKVIGGAAGDNITGNAAANSLTGSGGNDTLNGGAGNDSLAGGGGSDSLVGGADNDLYNFGTATAAEIDTIVELAGQGIDTLAFGLGSGVTVNLTSDATTATHTNRTVKTGAAGQAANFENVSCNGGNDVITGNNAANQIFGGGGNDNLSGGAGNDSLTGGEGSDTLAGGANDDTYFFANAAAAQTDVINEAASAGTDTLDFAALTTGVTVNLTLDAGTVSHANRTINTFAAGQAANFENVIGGNAGDNITGNAAANTLTGNNGHDTLTGGDGSDSLVGGFGNDVYAFGAAAAAQTDTIVELASAGLDTLDFSALGAGVPINANLLSDTLTTTHTNRTVRTGASGQVANIENVTGGAGNDIIGGSHSSNTLSGGAGNDSISGVGASDVLIDGEGNDTLVGGAGNDVYKFSDAAAAQTDRVNEQSGGGTDTLDFSSVTTDVTINLSSDTLATHTNRTVLTFAAGLFANLENATGGSGNDTITGNSLANQLLGMGGNDTFFAQDGTALADTVDGGNDTDTVSSSDASDLLLNVP